MQVPAGTQVPGFRILVPGSRNLVLLRRDIAICVELEKYSALESRI